MSKRLQVLFDAEELRDIQAVARAQHMTVAEWVRQTLRRARNEAPIRPAREKLEVLREASAHSFPSGDIEEMLDEIEQGRASGLPR